MNLNEVIIGLTAYCLLVPSIVHSVADTPQLVLQNGTVVMYEVLETNLRYKVHDWTSLSRKERSEVSLRLGDGCRAVPVPIPPHLYSSLNEVLMSSRILVRHCTRRPDVKSRPVTLMV